MLREACFTFNFIFHYTQIKKKYIFTRKTCHGNIPPTKTDDGWKPKSTRRAGSVRKYSIDTKKLHDPPPAFFEHRTFRANGEFSRVQLDFPFLSRSSSPQRENFFPRVAFSAFCSWIFEKPLDALARPAAAGINEPEKRDENETYFCLSTWLTFCGRRRRKHGPPGD